MKKLGRNDLCHCGSGKKYKRCHQAGDRENLAVAFDNGIVATLSGVTVSLVTKYESQVPEWLLKLARDAVRDAGLPGAAEREGLAAVVLIAAAAEAIVNRLIEPLVSSEEFFGKDKQKGLESASMRKKWVRLSELLKMKPHLQPETVPLKPLLDAIDVRNDVMHFKYGKNRRETRGTEVEGVKQAGRMIIPLDAAINSPQESVGEVVDDKIAPSRVAGYLASLTTLLQVVLPLYPERSIAESIQKALVDELWFATKREANLWDALVRAQIFAEKALVDLKPPSGPAEEAVAGALFRLPKLLSGIRLLVSERQPLEAHLLVRALTEIAVTAAWTGLNEENGRSFSGESINSARAWVDILKKYGGTWVEKDQAELESLFRDETNRVMPPLEQRALGLSEDAQEINELTRRQSVAALNVNWRLANVLVGGKPGSRTEDVLLFACVSTMILVESVGSVLKIEGAQSIVDAIQVSLNR